MAPFIGTRVGPYEILAAIGAGGMSDSDRARIVPKFSGSKPDSMIRRTQNLVVVTRDEPVVKMFADMNR
jgi:hypothetical protein